MAFELSFSPEFFLAEGEPYDRLDLAVNVEGEPVSVYSAICALSEKERAEIAREVFGCDDWEAISAEAILDKIRETNTCRDLTSPVEVYIDEQGNHSVFVYDGPEER